jgi:hypothetical protein
MTWQSEGGLSVTIPTYFPFYFFFPHHVTWTNHLTTHVTLGQVIITMTHRLLGLYYRFQTLSHDDSF